MAPTITRWSGFPPFAGKNEVVFAVMNDVVNELGTGGIVAPVILYAPAGGKDAKLENLRPLGETLPSPGMHGNDSRNAVHGVVTFSSVIFPSNGLTLA